MSESNTNIAIFDFDYTLVNANSTNYLNKLVIEREQSVKNRTPSIAKTNQYRYDEVIENLNDPKDHTIRLNKVLEYMQATHKLTRDDMEKCLGDLKIGTAMRNALDGLTKQGYTLAIVSDSNKFVIETILRHNALYDLFADRIYANESVFDDRTGRLSIVPLNKWFNNPNGDEFNCETSQYCRRNICKGRIVEYLIGRLCPNRRGGRVVYVGDGSIDYCPGLKLEENDLFFVKKNSILMRLLQKSEHLNRVRACVKYWNNGDDILMQI